MLPSIPWCCVGCYAEAGEELPAVCHLRPCLRHTPNVTPADREMVTTIRSHLSDEMGRLQSGGCHQEDLVRDLAQHIFAGLHLEMAEAITTMVVENWMERAMTLLLDAAQVETRWKPRNTIAHVPSDVAAGIEVAA